MSLSVEAIAHALVNIYKRKVDIDHEVEENLFQETRQIFNEAISEGYANAAEKDVPLPDDAFRSSFKHSADVFSAFRVHRMQKDIAAQMIDDEGQVKPFQKFVRDVSPYIEHRNRAWLRTEYDTAILRAQNAAEWKMFEAEKDVYPNLEWIQSTSPDPGADHMIYWGTIRPVDDPFWSEHKPGDRWNCKCELRQTDKNATALPVSDGKSDPMRGLESNPAKAEELFSDHHPYYPSNCASCPFAGSKLMALARSLRRRKNCNACKRVNKEIDRQRIIANRKEYERLKKDPNYFDVEFNEKTGGVKATHIGHNLDKVGGKYELDTLIAGVKAGNIVVLENEKGEGKHTEGLWNGKPFEVAGCQTGTANNIVRGLKHCASKRKTEFAVIVLPNTDFDKVVFETAIKRFKGLEKLNDGQYLKFKKIICVHNQEVVYITDGI
ncbi:MAG: hypothetical protein IJW01_07710 [Paludibacteraceae bacterium]|nr:hypothetical protein [Paludibacteraceae bacterium]